MIEITAEDPSSTDIVALLEAHLAFAHQVTPADHVHALGGRGVGRRMVEYLIDVGRSLDLRWVGLETGTDPAFAPARSLYHSLGFEVCPPFEAYTDNPFSVCMERAID